MSIKSTYLWLKQWFCRHDYDKVTFFYYPEQYETRECIKCGKVKYFEF